MKYLKIYFKGFLMGIAEVIPGVSGSTIAIIVGVYEKFIDFLHSISDFCKFVLQTFFALLLSKNYRKLLNFTKYPKFVFKVAKNQIDFSFGIPLFVGMFTSILLLSRIISFFFENYREYVLAFFFGLILCSIHIPISKIKKVNIKIIFVFFLTFLLTFILLDNNSNYRIEIDPSFLLLFLGGILGISFMMLPGVSGAFILLLLGIYEYIISLVKDIASFNISFINIFKLLVFMLGIITGFIFFVRIVKWGFSRYPDIILTILSGIMLASLRVVYPFVVLHKESYNYNPVSPLYYIFINLDGSIDVLNSKFFFIIFFILVGFLAGFVLNKLFNNN